VAERSALVVTTLADRGLTLATAESLTAGLVCADLADIPGCSQVLRGGIVAYDVEVKAAVLGLDGAVLARGVVSRPVAEAMAQAARLRLGADVGVATTGVAGPEPHGGEPVGSVWIAVAVDGRVRSEHLSLDGDRAAIRCQTVAACWDLVLAVLGVPFGGPPAS
jgi:nicotinamide-nucleotide amidase